jgi:ribosomal protein L11 methyltransferase
VNNKKVIKLIQISNYPTNRRKTLDWNQIILQISKLDVDEISAWLTDQNAIALTYEDAKDVPILEPGPGETPYWDEVELTALFESDAAVEKIMILLKDQFGEKIQSSKIAQLKEQQWERSWMDSFKAMKFGTKLWICPSWETVPNPDAVNIILDPGLAFGTGTHETTALCLEWLEAEELTDKTVIDYGCGSGILAIAAVKLGAKKVIATDNDPQAITASRENAKRNNISDQQIGLILANSQITPEMAAADVLVANILAEPLRLLAPELANKIVSGGRIALSGLLAEQAEEIMGIYKTWFEFNPVKIMGDWCLLNGIKK